MKEESRVGKTAVVVGTITNDVRLYEVPKLTVSRRSSCSKKNAHTKHHKI